ncbi:hypothetical protein NQ317_003748 [Molorchus minor]|uniref:Zinc finger C2H2 LYAR-type domain-containing protein n=1 Tax=Molorchus minor TaxID=1323400 RepID=A0ABQ9JSI9_9CUCU|nr:hypothetical protein NQ317_003748 [Molorchus minor]
MVVFTCNNCGESLQKPKVEKHYAFACRKSKSLTCVDCFKDFRGEEYVVHTKCITEDERYAAKGTYVNGIVKKGENFIKNSTGGRVNMEDVVEVWNIIEHHKNSQSKTNPNEHGQTKTKEQLECEENDNVIKEKNLKNDMKRKTNTEETEETITKKKET